MHLSDCNSHELSADFQDMIEADEFIFLKSAGWK